MDDLSRVLPVVGGPGSLKGPAPQTAQAHQAAAFHPLAPPQQPTARPTAIPPTGSDTSNRSDTNPQRPQADTTHVNPSEPTAQSEVAQLVHTIHENYQTTGLPDMVSSSLTRSRHQRIAQTAGRTAADASDAANRPALADVDALSARSASQLRAHKQSQLTDQLDNGTGMQSLLNATRGDDTPHDAQDIVDTLVQAAPEQNNTHPLKLPAFPSLTGSLGNRFGLT